MPHRPCIRIFGPQGVAVLEGVTLLEEACHCGVSFEVSHAQIHIGKKNIQDTLQPEASSFTTVSSSPPGAQSLTSQTDIPVSHLPLLVTLIRIVIFIISYLNLMIFGLSSHCVLCLPRPSILDMTCLGHASGFASPLFLLMVNPLLPKPHA